MGKRHRAAVDGASIAVALQSDDEVIVQVRIHGDVDDDRCAADLAVFDVGLRNGADVDRQLDRRVAPGTMRIAGLKWVHRVS